MATPITWSVASAAAHGTAVVSGTGTSKTIGYTPATGYTGADSFVVQATDGNGGTDMITVSVTIRAIENELPGLLAEYFRLYQQPVNVARLVGKNPGSQAD